MRVYTADNTILYRAINNPGWGYCGWAAVALGYYDSFARAQDVRETVLGFIEGMSLETRTETVFQMMIHRNPDALLTEEEFAQLDGLEGTLTAAPGVMDQRHGLSKVDTLPT